MQGLLPRTAANFAVFFLPHLWPELRLLDCGCGPGSITLGLAAAVAPSETVGIDWEAKRIKVAKQHGVQEGITNVRFAVANVDELPFADGQAGKDERKPKVSLPVSSIKNLNQAKLCLGYRRLQITD